MWGVINHKRVPEKYVLGNKDTVGMIAGLKLDQRTFFVFLKSIVMVDAEIC